MRIRVARAEFAFESVRSREYREEELVRPEPRIVEDLCICATSFEFWPVALLSRISGFKNLLEVGRSARQDFRWRLIELHW